MDEDRLVSAVGEWQKTKFQIGTTHFDVRKLLVDDAFWLLEEVREGMGVSFGNIDLDDQIDLRVHIVKAVLGAPRELVRSVRDQLFANVLFRNQHNKTPVPLLGSEDSAFDGLSAFDIYEVLVRCLAVNFFDSLSEKISSLNQAELNSDSPNTPTSIH